MTKLQMYDKKLNYEIQNHYYEKNVKLWDKKSFWQKVKLMRYIIMI